MERKYLLPAILIVCVIAGCVAWFGLYDNSRKVLSEDVAGFSRRCPLEMAPGTVILSVDYADEANNVTMHIAVTSMVTAVVSDKTPHTDKLALLFQEDTNRRLLKDMVKAGATLTLSYEGAASGESIYADAGIGYADLIDTSVVYTAAELSDLETRPLPSVRDRAATSLHNRVTMLNEACPMEWSDGSELVNIGADPEAGMLVMYIRGAKGGGRDYQTKLFKSELKARRHDNKMIRTLVKELVSVGYGIRVIYQRGDGTPLGGGIEIPAEDVYKISQLR